MLRVIFFGIEREILDELRNHSEIIGVFIPPSKFNRWKLRDKLLSNFHMRRLLHPFLKKYPVFFRKWLRTLATYGLSDYVRQNHLHALYVPSVNDPKLLQTISEARPDLGVIANFGKILDNKLLCIPRHGFINFHPSLLPKYRGPAPLGHILLNGETRSGVTWHQTVEKVDSGDILAQKEFSISPMDTEKDLIQKSCELGKKMLGPLLHIIEEGRCQPRFQNESEATYYPKLTTKEKECLRKRNKNI